MKNDIRKVNIIGPYFGQSGYDIHTNNLAKALNKIYEVSITCNRPQNCTYLISDNELKMLQRNPEEADVNIMIGLPHCWDGYLNEDKPFIGFVVWEGDKIPKFWIDYLLDNRVKQIWVPSHHTRHAILNTYQPEVSIVPEGKKIPINKEYSNLINKIKVVPHGVDTSIFYPKPELKDKPFTFIANKGWRGDMNDRGGLQFLFKAFNEEFTKNDDVQLVVKINSVYQQINLEQALNNLRLEKDKAPIHITINNLQHKALNDIYNKGHVFVSPTMAEAFNLPCLEAMACGLPVITSDFGGQYDYSVGWFLEEGEMFEVKHDPMYEGVQWKKPSIKELRRLMRMLYQKQEAVKEMGEKALEESKKWTWDKSAEKAKECLEELNDK